MSDGAQMVSDTITAADGVAICAYLTGGYPTPEKFPEVLASISQVAEVVEIGVPFTDPMADGLTIQRAGNVALSHGVDLEWLLDTVGSLELNAPHLFMGYFNPFLSFGFEKLFDRMAEIGMAGVIVPDLSLEESDEMRTTMDRRGLALVQLVAPTTPPDRLGLIAEASRGFVYAVTATGVTGHKTEFDQPALDYLDRVSSLSRLPVLAGFGVRERSQVDQLAGHVDGVVVGSALIDTIDDGGDAAEFLADLRPKRVTT